MGTNVHGYVEVNGVELTGETHWSKIIEIGLFVERDYEIFGLLFGVRVDPTINGIAKNRGIPDGTSMPQDHDNKGLHGQTWIDWEEIAEVYLELPKLRGWNLIFSAMELQFEQFGKKSTRLVVSFDN
jgi:hypothetical protein